MRNVKRGLMVLMAGMILAGCMPKEETGKGDKDISRDKAITEEERGGQEEEGDRKNRKRKKEKVRGRVCLRKTLHLKQNWMITSQDRWKRQTDGQTEICLIVHGERIM